MRLNHTSLLLGLAVGALLALAPGAAFAQGHSEHGKHHEPPGQAKKHVVTTDQAILVTRDVLGKHGYTVVRVVNDGDTRVVYYRRGNMGKGKGQGPIEKIIVRPTPDRVIFESAPKAVLVDINVKLGF